MNLDQVKRELEERLDRLTGRLSVIDSELRSPGSADSEDRALESENKEVLDRLSESERDELQSIRRALGRIREGTYTVCTACGKTIPEARLVAVPDTTLCVRCAGA